MKKITAGLLGTGLLLCIVVLSGAAIVDVRDAARQGSFCPNGAACTHEFDHDAPAVLDDLIRCATTAMTRQMTQFEHAVLVASGVPSHALR